MNYFLHRVRMSLGFIAGASLLGVPTGCRSASQSSSPYTHDALVARNSLEAEALNLRAAAVLDSDAERAERLLRQALAADLYFGPAHNNLGVLYLKQGKLYEAAGEFEWARKLMPGHPDPRMNLVLTLETAGRTDDALTEYNSALEVYPEHLPTIQALTRLQIRAGKRDGRTRDHLANRRPAVHRSGLAGMGTRATQWRDVELQPPPASNRHRAKSKAGRSRDSH